MRKKCCDILKNRVHKNYQYIYIYIYVCVCVDGWLGFMAYQPF